MFETARKLAKNRVVKNLATVFSMTFLFSSSRFLNDQSAPELNRKCFAISRKIEILLFI